MEHALEIIDDWIKLDDPTAILNLSRLELTELPEIPLNCQQLFCSRNQLTSLPELPECTILSCEDNNLLYLPSLPKCVR